MDSAELFRKPHVDLEDLDLKEDIVIRYTEDEKLIGSARFINCRFDSLHLEYSFTGLVFINCTIKKLTLLRDLRNFDSGERHHTQHIRITNCRIETLIINIDINYHVDEIEISGDQSEIGSLEFRVLSKRLLIIDLIVKRAITLALHNGGDSLLRNINCPTVSLSGACAEFVLENCRVNLSTSHFKGSLNFNNCSAGTFRLYRCSGAGIKFQSCQDCNIELTDIGNINVYLVSGSYNSVRFHSKGELNFRIAGKEKVYIKHLLFSEFQLATSAVVAIDYADVENLILSFVNNGGIIRIVNSNILDTFVIERSDLKKTTFNNVNLSLRCELVLLDTDIADTQFNNFNWNRNFQLSEALSLDRKRYKEYLSDYHMLLTLRESYRQLKSNLLKNNNKIIALEFQKHELQTHYRILKQAIKTKQYFISGDRLHRLLGDLAIMWTHRFASDFGQSIWRPLFLLFLFHLIFFNVLILITPELNLVPLTDLSVHATLDGVGKFFYTLLPIHSYFLPAFQENTMTEDMVFIAGFWDFVIRLSSGYFIFYFIAASRKYHQ